MEPRLKLRVRNFTVYAYESSYGMNVGSLRVAPVSNVASVTFGISLLLAAGVVQLA